MILTRTKTGDPLISAEEAARFLKVTEPTEHPLILALVDAATEHCEGYTGRDVRAHDYQLLRWGFSDDADGAILLGASLVASIASVDRLVSGTFTAVTSSNYYLAAELSCARVRLISSKAWPTDLDTRDQNVRVLFSTKAHTDVALAKAGILRHLALMYADRGDMEPMKTSGGAGGEAQTLAASTARQSGAEQMYAPIALVGI